MAAQNAVCKRRIFSHLSYHTLDSGRLYPVYVHQGATISMQENPGRSGRLGMSACLGGTLSPFSHTFIIFSTLLMFPVMECCGCVFHTLDWYIFSPCVFFPHFLCCLWPPALSQMSCVWLCWPTLLDCPSLLWLWPIVFSYFRIVMKHVWSDLLC